MNEVIEKMYQEAFDLGTDRLYTSEIDESRTKIEKLIETKFDASTQNEISWILGDICNDSSKAGFEAGFRAAVRFFMNVWGCLLWMS